MRAMRGNAVPELMFTVSFTLLVLLGIIQIATTAFYQVSADGASFVAAHDTVASQGSPTTASAGAAQTSAQAAFRRIVTTAVSVLNPSNSTFETDVSQQIPGISGIGNPSALTITSRTVEPSAGTQTTTPGTLPDCVTAAENITNGATQGASNGVAPITGTLGLVQPDSLVSVSQGTTNALQLNLPPLTNRIAELNTVSTDLKTLFEGGTLTVAGQPVPTSGIPGVAGTIGSTIATLKALPGVGALVSTLSPQITTSIEASINTIVQTSLSGTFTQSSAVATVNANLSAIPLIGPILSLIEPVIDTALTGGTTAEGIIGASGPLGAVDGDMAALKAIDAQAQQTCTAL